MQGLDHYDVACDFEVITINTDLQGDLRIPHPGDAGLPAQPLLERVR